LVVRCIMGFNTRVADIPPTTDALRASVEGLCVPGVLAAVVQPIVGLSDMTIVGYEALTRIPLQPPNAPDWWLDRAGELNLRAQLEVACWRTIIELGPPPDDRLLFLNVSPATLAEPDLLALRDALPERVVIEVTEQEAVADYARLREDLRPWIARNMRLAIDDAGSGYASLRHVIELVPDFIKIDHSLVHGIDTDRNRRALVHSLVAFAREVGITVIAEGIETEAELDIVRDAEVSLGQGYLFARPERAWPEVAYTAAGHSGSNGSASDHRPSSPALGEDARLENKLAQATDAKAACEAVVESLYRRGQLMPSLYLEFEGQLRCIAQRGLWQVLDGMSGSTGVTGKTWASKEPTVISDVRQSPDYLEAIPGVISETCVPIVCEGEAIGALNVESLVPLGANTVELLQRCAELLVARLKIVGWRARDLPWRRASRASTTISRLAPEDRTPEAMVEILCEASGMDSVCLIKTSDDARDRTFAIGPLGSILSALPDKEIADLARLVDSVRSCYTASDTMGRGFVGTESIREFARAVIVLPLRSGGVRIGTVVLANSRPRALSGEEVEALEIIVDHLASSLQAAELITHLGRKAHKDALTGIGNRAAFDEELEREVLRPDSARRAALVVDIDHFKKINDAHGHLTGDDVLRCLAEQLAKSSTDVQVFRYGGDEFACLIPHDDPHGTTAIAKALCENADRALLEYGSSVTAGLAIAREAESPWATFGRADDALLTAKRHFRGEVILHSDFLGSVAKEAREAST
jgi:diguanylate cyclase (GGDEF)-like protein